MKFLDQLLERLHSRPSMRTMDGANTHNPNISKIIDDALASAGLGRDTTQGGHIAGVIDDALARAGLLGADGAPAMSPVRRESTAPVALPRTEDGIEPPASSQGQFLSRTFASPAGALAYKLYVPSGYDADSTRAVPLLVMLHGCTQSPDDFAAGTRMNAQADLHGFVVAYPAQSATANANKCWNWFRPQDQSRGGGEPALIAGMTAQIGADYRVDPARIYVAGLSAGAAMAVVMGRTYPDLFAAVGAHSGLPYRAAHDMVSAFSAMRIGAAGVGDAQVQASGKLTPTIVFHGDRDQTVAATNGDAIVAHQTSASGAPEYIATRDSGKARGGRDYARTTYADASGRIVVEDWRVHGGGHAWMGGSASGSYTDPQGPDASAEMVRFFLRQARQGS
ncbi:MAG: alpha/beta hydrolase family esterase [Thermomonas sp.]